MPRKYDKKTVRKIPYQIIGKELLDAQKDNIATPNPDVTLIEKEITRRLKRLFDFDSKKNKRKRK
jgi:hypothetical protein